MNNQLKEDHYVYALLDLDNKIRFIGHGRKDRYLRKQGRTKEYLNILNSGGTFEFLLENVSKLDAINFISDNINSGSLNGKQLDIICAKVKPLKDILYSEISKYVYYDESSYSKLRWVDDAVQMGLDYRAFNVKKDHEAGQKPKPSGYCSIRILGENYQVHRIIWCLCNKMDVPWSLVVNHIDSDRTNNHPSNLELVSYSTNSKKKLPQYNNTSGVIGVCYSTTNNQYIAHVYVDGNFVRKSFSANKYGDSLALELAANWRNEMESIHYTAKHKTHDTLSYI